MCKEWKITRDTLKDYKDKKAHNVYVAGMFIGSYEGPLDLTNEVEKKAALVSSAPELLEALAGLELFMTACGYFVNQANMAKQVRSRIAKARGVK